MMQFLANVLVVPGWAIALIVVVAILLSLTFMIFIIIVLHHYNANKATNKLKREADYLSTLLTGKIASNISRIELISRTNLLYVEVHEQLKAHLQPIMESLNEDLAKQIARLEKLIQNREYNGIGKKILDTQILLKSLKGEILAFEREIDEIIKPEEDARNNALRAKEEFRDFKKRYSQNESEMSIVSESFQSVFENVNEKFMLLDRLIESAEYIDANTVVSELLFLFKELDAVLTKLPEICILLETVIPQKISDVTRIYDQMEGHDYPLRHLRVKGGIAEMESDLAKMRVRLKNLDVSGIYERLDYFNNQLEQYMSEFDKEKLAKIEFERIYGSIADVVSGLHKRYIKLANNIHEVRRYYMISQNYEGRLEELKKQIDDITSIKRNLDTFVHSSTGQHYSLLVLKARQLEEKGIQCEASLNTFQDYLSSLRADAEKAYQTIRNVFFKLFEIKRKNVEIVAVEVRKQFDEMITTSYQTLSELDAVLKALPIDIERVNELSGELETIFEHLSEEIEKAFRAQEVAELSITYANSLRFQFSEVNRQMLQIESSFWDGDYERAAQEASAILRKHGANIQNLNG